MRASARALCVAALSLLLAACLTVGRPFPVEPVREIKIGQTTKDDVRRIFGQPWRTGLEDGQRTWTYGHYRYAALGTTRTRDFVVRFDDQGRVVSYTFNSTYPEDAF